MSGYGVRSLETRQRREFGRSFDKFEFKCCREVQKEKCEV